MRRPLARRAGWPLYVLTWCVCLCGMSGRRCIRLRSAGAGLALVFERGEQLGWLESHAQGHFLNRFELRICAAIFDDAELDATDAELQGKALLRQSEVNSPRPDARTEYVRQLTHGS